MRALNASIVVSLLVAALAGCSGDSPPTPSKMDAGDGGDTKDGATAGHGSAGNGAAGQTAVAGAGAGVGGDAADDDAGGMPLPGPLTNPWIAFVQIGSDGFGQLAFVKANGKGLAAFKGAGSETDPSWSPDGKRLAFAQFESGVGNSLHVLDFTTGKDKALGTGSANLARPRWSADGKTIVASGTTSSVAVPALFRVDATSGALQQITQSGNGDGGHDLMPDGTLYFVRRLDATTFEIFSVASDADPTVDATQITTGSGVLGGVSTNPDGVHIYYARDNGTTTELIERNVATGKERTIGLPGDKEARAFVGVDKLVLSRDSFDSDSEIAVVDDDGKLLRRCTSEMLFDVAPAPSPVESYDIDLSPFLQ